MNRRISYADYVRKHADMLRDLKTMSTSKVGAKYGCSHQAASNIAWGAIDRADREGLPAPKFLNPKLGVKTKRIFHDDEVKSVITKLWNEGVSIAQIEHRTGVPRNTVPGMAKRLGLPPRGTFYDHTGRSRSNHARG
jgi:hypothetical protein